MKKSRTAIGLVLIVVFLLTLVAGCGQTKKEEKTVKKDNKVSSDYVVKLGYYNCDHMTAACVAKDAGIFDKLGLKVTVTGNGEVPEAMAAAKMDVGYIGADGLMFAHMKGSPIFVAANNHIGGSYYLVVSNRIKKASDLVGKKVALGTDAEKNNAQWIWMAKRLGIPADTKKYQNFDMDLKNKYLAMKNGQLDAYLCCDPWGSMAEYENTGRIIETYRTTPNGKDGLCCVYAMRDGFAKEHPDLAKKMILAHTQAVEYIYLHPVTSAKIFAKNYYVPEEVALMTIYKKTVGEGRTLTWNVDNADFKNFFEEAKEVPDYKTYQPLDQWINTGLLKQSGADDFDTFIKTKVDPVFPEGMSYADWKKKAYEVDGK
ncbi:MAG: ABC transporter substrate-binding subunit SaoX [Chitinophagales bacterium]